MEGPKSKMHPYYKINEKNSLNTIQHERLERENDDDIEQRYTDK